METIHINGKTGSSRIVLGDGLPNLENYLSGTRTVIITDNDVWKYYGNQFPAVPVIRIGSGEKIKTLDTVQSIYEQLMNYEVDRDAFLIGIGGGIVCDITGFVASTYLRGLRFGYVATSLLGQVDASVGGKTGVNFKGFKNMIGTFTQPEFVLCDFNLLATLPEEERRCGWAEIIKHGAIADPELFNYLESHFRAALDFDRETIEKVVYASIMIKARIVNADEREKGERRKLNFGHTFGHALEKITGRSHGEAVSAGMVMASALSVKKGLLDRYSHQRLRSLLATYRLPAAIPAENEELLRAVRRDKKRQDRDIHFVFLKAIGQAVVEKIGMEDLKTLLQRDE